MLCVLLGDKNAENSTDMEAWIDKFQKEAKTALRAVHRVVGIGVHLGLKNRL